MPELFVLRPAPGDRGVKGSRQNTHDSGDCPTVRNWRGPKKAISPLLADLRGLRMCAWCARRSIAGRRAPRGVAA